MELFYIPKVMHSEAILEGEELHHAARVLRKRTGDTLHFTDGHGTRYTGTITSLEKRRALVRIDSNQADPAPAYRVHLATALTKNIKRMEWCFEKITELGIDSIQPLICARSERKTLNVERMHKILLSAMKQSGRCTLPVLQPIASFEKVISDDQTTARYIAHKTEDGVDLAGHYQPGTDVVLLIGPEGDFTEKEVAQAGDRGFRQVNLGKHRLRTETAGMFAVANVHALNAKQ